jgi:hypothetical protein
MTTAKDTDQLIEHLAQAREPVRPLLRPWIRTAIWLALAVPYIAVVVLVMSPRADLAGKLGDARFLVEQIATLLTGITAAAAALATTIPGFDRRVILLPILPLAVWLASLGQGCLQDWIELGPTGLSIRPDWICFPAIALVGAGPAIVVAVMLRRGAPLTPHLSAALGGLAAAGFGNFGLRFFHPQDASLMVLVWQFGTVFVLSAAAAWAGRYLLNWHSLARRSRSEALVS